MGLPIYHSQYTAAQIEASIGKTPRIKAATRTWEIWDIATSAYVDTGVSIDTDLFVDSTLTEAGYAADAKVTGDKVTELKSALSNTDNSIFESVGANWVKGVFSASGSVTSSSNGVSSYLIFKAKKILLGSGCRAVVLMYSGNTYLGKINSDGTLSTSSGSWKYFTEEINVSLLFAAYNADGLKISIIPTDGTTITAETVTSYANAHYKALEFHFGETLADIEQASIEGVHGDADLWVLGEAWLVSSGGRSDETKWIRSAQFIDSSVIAIKSLSEYLFFLLAYNQNTYIGNINVNENFVTSFNSVNGRKYIDIAYYRNKYPNYNFRISVIRSDNAIPPSLNDFLQNVIVYRSKPEINRKAVEIINGNIIDPTLWENGTISADGSKGVDDNFYKRLSTSDYLQFPVPVTIIPKSGYSISVSRYTDDKTLIEQFRAWQSVPYTITNADSLYKIVIKADNSDNLTPGGVGNYIGTSLLMLTPFNRLLSECANIKAVNHRGYNFICPENTLPAYEMSADYGYKYVETDVLFTSDGVPVLMHDDTINRTCCNASDGSAISGDVSIESVSYEDLITDYDACTSAQWPTWKGIKVPTFAEFMYCCKVYNLHPWIELKWTHTYTQEEVEEIISIVKQYGMEEHVSFISFSYDALALVASEWDTVELGLNGTIANAKLLRTGKNRVFMIYNQSNSYADAIAEGFQVCVYTVNTVAQLSALTNQGFDSILTNGLLPSQVCDVVRCKYQSGV